MNKIIILVLAFVLIFTQSENNEEDGVFILTDKNFEEKVNEFGVTLVKFYAPWCGHCKKLAPEYSAAAKELKQLDPPVIISQVDCTVEKELAQKYEIQGFPTLKLFKNGKVIAYEGGRSKDDIVKFMKKHTGPVAVELNSDNYDKLMSSKINKIILSSKDINGKEYTAFADAAGQIEDGEFYYIIDSKFAESKEYKTPSLTLIVDNNKIVYNGEWKSDDIVTFIHGNELPPVIIFSQETARKLFGPQQTIHHQILLFGSKDNYEKASEDYTAAAKEFIGRALFIYVPPEETRIYEYFGIETSVAMACTAVNMGQEMKKYKYDSEEYNLNGFKKFVENFINNKLVPFLKSEEIPESQESAVIKVVGKTFEEIVLDKSKNVLVKFYAPWCGHCKALAPIYVELAEKLANKNDLVIAEFDATANEVDHPDVHIKGYPTIKLFLAESNKVIDYDGERDLNGFMAFLKTHVPSIEDNNSNNSNDKKGKDEL